MPVKHPLAGMTTVIKLLAQALNVDRPLDQPNSLSRRRTKKKRKRRRKWTPKQSAEWSCESAWPR
jgi:hypothetical protein